jgi:membrane fusion protein, multidrug efflux system
MPIFCQTAHLLLLRRSSAAVTYQRPKTMVLSLLALLSLLAACKENEKVSAAPPPTPVRVDTVRLVPANSVARYSGVVRPRIEADIGFRVGGKVVERYVDVGSLVEAGTMLARLDPADLDLQVRAAEAQLLSATTDAANARDVFVRYAQLYKAGRTARQDYDKHKALMETSNARVKQFEAQLRTVRNNARYATLVSDGAGVVTAVAVEPGQVVAQGQSVLKIARPGELEVVADIPEAQIGLLEQAALLVELWSRPGIAVAGRMREISPSADPATRTYRVRVTLAEPSPGTQFGMTATLVATQRRDGHVVRLPLTALTQDGQAPAVWVVNQAGDGIALRPVTVGDYTGTDVNVMSGLSEGERVVTAGVHKLFAAQRIRAWTEPVR